MLCWQFCKRKPSRSKVLSKQTQKLGVATRFVSAAMLFSCPALCSKLTVHDSRDSVRWRGRSRWNVHYSCSPDTALSSGSSGSRARTTETTRIARVTLVTTVVIAARHVIITAGHVVRNTKSRAWDEEPEASGPQQKLRTSINLFMCTRLQRCSTVVTAHSPRRKQKFCISTTPSLK